MRATCILCASVAILAQARAIWPFDSDSSSTSDSTETSTPSDDGESWIRSVVGNLGGSGSETSSTNAAASTDDSNPYAPYNSTCPSGSLTREANDISDPEKEYIQKRQAITNKNLINFLQNKSNLTDFDAESFINDNAKDHNISIGLAFSGGGYRAMLCGAGQLLATDDRFEGANEHGVGGLLQASTYITGLSGGNWLVGSLVMNNWLSVAEVVNGSSSIWALEDSILNPSGIRIDKTIAYYYGLRSAVLAKDDAGFDTTITDIWGRALSYQFFPDESGGENITWSSVRNMSHFEDHTMPYFLVVSNARRPGDLIINENSTVIEISAYELGSWDPSLNAFADVEYLGSSVDSGNPNNTSVCVRNFDNAGFIMGTSSSLFNQVLLQLGNYDINSVIKTILEGLLSRISYAEWDIASYEPNPFFGQGSGESVAMVKNETLFLVDGGEDLQNVPFYPLIQNTREVDVIFAFDNSADTEEGWPNATSIVSTYKRQFAEQGKGTPFPFVPDVEKFLDEDLSSKPVFFGCNASDLDALIQWHNNTDINATDVPLVVYVSNHYQSYYSNFSTFKLSYENAEKFGTIRNGFEVMSRKNLTDDSDWLTCVGCAIIRRQQERFGQEQSDECKQCFQNYCWSGGVKDAAPVSSASGLSEITGLRTSSVQSTSSTATSSGGSATTSSGSENTSSSGSSSTSSSKKNEGVTTGRQPPFFFLLGNLLLAALAA
ncbi:plb1 [Candida margitis]|uniref:plb1 n=1 Tax=Candida margitis TaxID=1775924 RepID=UPI002227C3BF|nr:plb1 [Candida margitis]KAI5968664.1 plb1 [Candida margitis]